MINLVLRNTFYYRFCCLIILVLLFNSDSFAVAPTANFSANNLVICVGQTSTFTSSSTGTITSYSWNFGSGASPSTSTSAGPITVTYTTSGLKTISLTVSGPDGNATMTKSGYVSVGFDRVKIMSYNLLNYPDNDGGSISNDTSARNPHYRTIMSAANPDILVVEEILNSAGVNGYLSNVMNANSNTYSKGTFIDGFDSDNAIFFKTSKFTFISNTPIITELRNISEFKLKHNSTGDTIRIYAVHLKASNMQADEDQRGREVDSLRKVTNQLPAGSYFMVCGDFNIYRDSEEAYLDLKQNNPGDDGNFYDPINLNGIWNNSSYAQYHTQSSRGGSFGGLDDRFDMILHSNAINSGNGISYVSGSLMAYGNDGNHYNDSVNQMPNTAVSTAVANALFFASDHIPVMESFDFLLSNCQALDFGATVLVNPVTPACPKSAVSVQVQIKNYSTTTVNFSSSNLDVDLEVTDPGSVLHSYTTTLNSGSLASGATMNVNFFPVLDMSQQGNYNFDATTVLATDINTSNNAMPTTTVNVSQVGTTTISPSGPITICSPNTVTLTSQSGSSYLWSNSATTQAIVVTTSGNYSVVVTDANGCLATASPVSITVNQFAQTANIFTENMGSVGGTTSIATHETNNGFQNTSFTMSGNADVRNTNGSAGQYTGASGNANIFFTSTASKNFIISGINTTSFNNIQLSFGIRKEDANSDGSDFLVKVSSDGVNYSNLFIPILTGPVGWQFVNATGSIPSVPNLRIQFIQTGSTYGYRLDDVTLAYVNSAPTINAQGPTTFCQGGSVILAATSANAYLWSNNQTTQSISVVTSGNYSVVETGPNGCTATSNIIPVTVNPTITPSVSIAANPGNIICQGTSVTFNATPTNGGSTPSYQWKVGTTNVGTGPSYTTTSLVNGNIVTCVMTSNASCLSGNPATSNAITMTVNPNVTASLSISANPGNTICSGANVTFTASPTNGGTTPSYQWKIGTTNVGTNSTTYSSTGLSNGNSISCTMISNAACVSGSPVTSNSIAMTVNQSITASVNIAADFGNTICTGTNVSFMATPAPGINSPTYQWKKNGINAGANSSTYSDAQLASNDIIICTLTTSQACVSPASVSSNSLSFTVNDPDDNNGCTTDACESSTGNVSHAAVTINDNNECTIDACNSSNGAITHDPVNTNDNNPCTTDGCDPITGIYHNTSPEVCGNNLDDDCDGFIDEGCSQAFLGLKIFIEGFYTGNGEMVASVDPVNYPTLCDTLIVDLHAPGGNHAILFSSKGTIDINGSGSFGFPSSIQGNSYYIGVRHRNAIETWSASPVLISGPVTSFIFSDAVSKAYGNNQKDLGDGNFAFFSGDISDANSSTVGIQDGVIESQDYSEMENAVSVTLLGYIPQDITGDGVVESSDYGLMETNVFFTYVSMHP